MQIILAGGGDPPQSLAVDLYYRNLLGDGASVAFLPHAIVIPKTWSESKALSWLTDRDAMDGINVHVYQDLTENRDKIDSAKSIFIMGGNTYCLLDAYRSSGFLDHLRQTILKGSTIVYGCSAGAILMGHSIRSAAMGNEPDDNYINLTNLEALDILRGMEVFTHYVPENAEAVANLSQETGRPVLCIPEDGGAFWDGHNLTSIGQQALGIFYPSGSAVQIHPGNIVEVL